MHERRAERFCSDRRGPPWGRKVFSIAENMAALSCLTGTMRVRTYTTVCINKSMAGAYRRKASSVDVLYQPQRVQCDVCPAEYVEGEHFVSAKHIFLVFADVEIQSHTRS